MYFQSSYSSTFEEVRRPIDRYAVGGLALSFLIIAVGVVSSDRILLYLNPTSLGLVLGGTLGATLLHFSFSDIRSAWSSLRNALYAEESQAIERILHLVKLANQVKQEGALVLEDEARRTRDPFLRKSLEVAVDGHEPDVIKLMLETEARVSGERAFRSAAVVATMGSYAPAMGLIGTLIGLIQMMNSLNNPALVGPSMALALVATLYGAVLANLVFLPMAGKLRNRAEEEILTKAITIEGAMGLRRAESPIVLEQRLKSFLPFHDVPR